ncbi:hypothetical protein [Aquabacterium sp.]|uniref:hypothetical protein n=1 Tax=Aquabacterium sp. TaxID=1872578 RepID=UPI003D6D8A97
MNFTRTFIAAALIASGSAAFAQAVINQNMAVAGNVTPGDTAGFPVTLSQPGSYKLTSNLFVPEGSAGVHITAANVTLDLNGFSIIGPSTCTRVSNTKVVTCPYTSSFAGVAVAYNAAGALVRGGTVKGFQSGVSSYASAIVEDITATFNMQGISFSVSPGTSFRLSGINANYNSGNGIDAGSAIGTIERSQSNHNGGKGINAKQGSVTLFNVQAMENFGHGIDGGAGHAVYATDNGNGTNASQNFYLFRSMGSNLNGTTQF